MDVRIGNARKTSGLVNTHGGHQLTGSQDVATQQGKRNDELLQSTPRRDDALGLDPEELARIKEEESGQRKERRERVQGGG